ncbi:MAG: hypothetical protein KC464_17820, partial [Myxococcales bacterium]|nr:hypothetical protein [Myxococcales bacterium]
QLRGPWTRLAFGRATVDGARLERALAIDVELGDGDARRRRRVELVGTTELCCGDDLATSVILVNKVQAEHHLRHALDHLVLAAAGVTAGAARTGLVLGDKIDDKALAPWTADAARDHLALLIGELLEQRHAYLLPYRVALDVLAGKTPRLRHATDKVATSLGFGPLRRDDGLTLPPDAADLARRRLGPLLDRMIGGRR